MSIGKDKERVDALPAVDLQTSEIRYRRIFESARDGILILDFDTRKITDVNPFMIELLGYKREQFLGRELWEIGLLKDEKASAAAFEELQKNHFLRYEDLPLKNKKGEKRNVEIVGNVYTENNRQIIQCNVRDITERKIFEEQTFNLAAIIGSSDEAIISKEFDGTITSWNKGAENIFGYTAAEIIGQNISILFPPDHRFEEIEIIKKIKRGERIHNFETVRLRKDGSRVPISLSNAPIKNKKGEIVAVSKIAHDITKRKRAEQEIRKLNETLEHRVVELNSANKELEAFSYSVSHDLRAPLRAIDGFSRALLEDYAGQIDEVGQDYLARVCAASAKMAELIDGLLILSRLSRDGMSFDDVNLSSLAREIAEKLRETEPERAAHFIIEDEIIVTGDERLLRIALQNLFDNAWKFTSKKEQGEIVFGQIRHGEKNEYFVRDNGAGFDMAYADKLFGVFQRLHTTKEFDGTGIGLVTVQRIVHRHGGLIRAEAKVDEGAAFYFTL